MSKCSKLKKRARELFIAGKVQELNKVLDEMRDKGSWEYNGEWHCSGECRADFSGLILKGSEKHPVDLSGLNLDGADMRDVRIIYAKMKGVSMRQCDIRKGKFIRVDLEDADLRRSNVEGAVFDHVDFEDANLGKKNKKGKNRRPYKLKDAVFEKPINLPKWVQQLLPS